MQLFLNLKINFQQTLLPPVAQSVAACHTVGCCTTLGFLFHSSREDKYFQCKTDFSCLCVRRTSTARTAESLTSICLLLFCCCFVSHSFPKCLTYLLRIAACCLILILNTSSLVYGSMFLSVGPYSICIMHAHQLEHAGDIIHRRLVSEVCRDNRSKSTTAAVRKKTASKLTTNVNNAGFKIFDFGNEEGNAFGTPALNCSNVTNVRKENLSLNCLELDIYAAL